MVASPAGMPGSEGQPKSANLQLEEVNIDNSN